MYNIKACLFDLDGVIVDTAKYHYLAWKKLADQYGFDFTLEDNERLKGVSRMDSLEILLSIGNVNVDEKTKLELAERKNNWYLEYISTIDSTEILPGVLDFIISLRENNIKIALGSVSKNASLILKNIGMTEYFHSIIDGTKITNAKPDPEVFLLGAKELGMNPENCVVFEDAQAGIFAAKNAGMKVIGIGSSVNLKEADKLIEGFTGITLDILNF
jgi:beta-phosphoglucomutase